MEICQYSIKRRERAVQKKAENVILNIPEVFTIMLEDESIFVHDTLIRRRMWTPKGIRPIVVTTGSHQKTYVFGTITIHGKQLIRQYKTFDQYSFISYPRELKKISQIDLIS
jgi:hypothetical protein